MTARALWLAVAAVVAAASPVVAQQNEPLPRFAVDVRGAMTGLPTEEGWTPAVPAGVQVPARTLGLNAGAHAYFLHYKLFALGVGGSVLIGRGHTSPADPPSGTMAPTTPLPEVTTRVTSLAPEISFNFGRRLGWSYLTVGLGRSSVRSERTTPATPTSPAMLERSGVKTLNYGGGARWFITDHLALNLDLRFYKLKLVAATDTSPSAPRASILILGAGLSVQ